MLGTFINCIAVIVGASIGLLLRKSISENFKDVVFSSSGLVTIVLGIGMALDSSNALVLLVSVILGGFAGYALKIEDGILKLGEKLQKATSGKGDANFARGFMSASVLFCSGAMTIVGSIQAGTEGNYRILLIKSVMDGCMAVVFGAAYGAGVIFSSLFILVYQGFFTLAGGWLQPVLGEAGINELAATGGILLLMIGLNLLDLKKFRTGNFLPALVFSPIIYTLFSKVPFLN